MKNHYLYKIKDVMKKIQGCVVKKIMRSLNPYAPMAPYTFYSV